jgi:hypothetical protein
METNKINKFDEKYLVRSIEQRLKSVFSSTFYTREFSAGYGIADLVFAKGIIDPVNNINRTPITNYYTLCVFLTLIKDEFVSINSMQECLNFLTRAQILRCLDFLVSTKYLFRVDKKFYSKNPLLGIDNPIKKIIAIEAKLTDYKNGLIQAKRYQYFADECYVAILKDAYEKIELQEYEDSNIGLIICDAKSGEIELKTSPKKQNNRKIHNVYTFAKELLYQEYLNF